MANSPKGVDLTRLLHGDPGADETGDEAAGERKDRVGGSKDTGRRGGGAWGVGQEKKDGEVSHSSLLALHLLFILIIIGLHF